MYKNDKCAIDHRLDNVCIQIELAVKDGKVQELAKRILGQFDLKDKIIEELRLVISPKKCNKCGSTQRIIIKNHCDCCAKYSDAEYRSKDNA